jgi:hypothetical protein
MPLPSPPPPAICEHLRPKRARHMLMGVAA